MTSDTISIRSASTDPANAIHSMSEPSTTFARLSYQPLEPKHAAELQETDRSVSLALCIWQDGRIAGGTSFNSISWCEIVSNSPLQWWLTK